MSEASLNGADFAEVFDENTLFEETIVTNEKIEDSSLGRECGVGIRIIKDLKCYYAHTNDRRPKKLLELTKILCAKMKNSDTRGLNLKPLETFGMEKGTKYPSNLALEEKLIPVREVIKSGMAYDKEIIRMRSKLTDFEQKIQIANTNGLYIQDTRVKTRLYIQAYAQNEKLTQTGYIGPGAMKGHEYYKTIDVAAFGKEAARQAKVLLHADPCPGGQMSVVVNNGFGGLLFHEACGHSLEATVIAKDASEFCGKIGTKVASDVVTLIDDGSIPNEWGSLHVDDEGSPTKKITLIENGVLKSYLVDCLNGAKLGLASTGSARRQNYKFAPVARMTNTYIAPGKSKHDEIIKNTEKGLYVCAINGGSVQPATGDFNFSTGECYLIENGEITRPVRGATLIGNGENVLKNVDMVADDYNLRQGYCYAGSGALFIGAGQPTIRVSNMTVGGIL